MDAFVTNGGIGSLIYNAGPVAKAVIVALVLFSLISSTIIFTKWGQLKRIDVSGDLFIGEIKRSDSLDKLMVKQG